MSKLTKCPARECEDGIFTYKNGPSTGKTRVCYRCNGRGVIDREAEKAAKVARDYGDAAYNALIAECRKRTGRIKSRLEDDVELGIMSLYSHDSSRVPKLWESVHAGRLEACITALVEYGKNNPLPPSP